MKRSRHYLYIALSSLALLVLLAIQVNWILHTARIKEELFNEKANMVLARTAEALSMDAQACRNLEAGLEATEIRKIDSLFRHFMKFYNFRLDYAFEVIRPDPFRLKQAGVFSNNVYNKRLDEVVTQNGLELKLSFPDKKQFIIAEMGPMFISSVVLILVLLLLFWRTVIALMKQKELLEHTTGFLNNMTHEFKTPLTNIALAGKMILKEAKSLPDAKIGDYAAIILGENGKLGLQVEQVLDMVALEDGHMPLKRVALDLHALIRESVACMQLQTESRGGQVSLALEAKQAVVLGDKLHLANALCSLLDNAIKYSPGAPVLSVRTENRGKDLLLKVTDQGIGIAPEYHQKVFGKFFRVPTGDVHEVKGSGLGLAYVKKVVALHGGSIVLNSDTGKGTTITVTLPYA